MSRRKSKQAFFTAPSDYWAFSERLKSILNSSTDYASRYLLTCLESKLLDSATAESPKDRRLAAINKWLLTEERNACTSVRLYTCDPDDPLPGLPVTIGRFTDFVSRLISDCLGPLEMEALRGSFSNGASTSQKRRPGVVPRKYQGGTDVTYDAYRVFSELNVSEVWTPSPNYVEGNVMFTVPKSTTIDRVACKEPDLCMYAQKAVGDYIRRRLKAKGIDLRDQKVNQDLCWLGSYQAAQGDNDPLATVDLSSASDSVTMQVVIMLLPLDWSDLIIRIRSPFTLVEGELHENDMISSMGNACTFELESLIFWALTRGVAYFSGTRGKISVYGDDIICPSSIVPALQQVFDFFGFTLNLEKSHFKGLFRESCGKHYYGGQDVSPFYVKEVPKDVSDWVHLLNSYRKWLTDQEHTVSFPRLHSALWRYYADKLIPAPIWGGYDAARRDILVADGRKPIARLAPKVRRDGSAERDYQYGALLQWLDTADRRSSGEPDDFGLFPGYPGSIMTAFDRVGVFEGVPCGRLPRSRVQTGIPREPLVTSEMTFDGELSMRRIPKRTYWASDAEPLISHLAQEGTTDFAVNLAIEVALLGYMADLRKNLERRLLPDLGVNLRGIN